MGHTEKEWDTPTKNDTKQERIRQKELGIKTNAEGETLQQKVKEDEERKAAKDKRIMERWNEDQRMRRRHWKGSAADFKAQLDMLMDDDDEHNSMWTDGTSQ